MEAGRDLDMLINEHVFGVKTWRSSGELGIISPPCMFFSTDIAAAWQVVEKVGIIALSRSMKADGDQYDGWMAWCDDVSMAEGETAPLAICRSALLAVGYEGSDDD